VTLAVAVVCRPHAGRQEASSVRAEAQVDRNVRRLIMGRVLFLSRWALNMRVIWPRHPLN